MGKYSKKTGAPVLIPDRFEGYGRGNFFLPFDVTKEEWKASQSRRIYHLDRIAQPPRDRPIIWVESEKCADAVTALGYLAGSR
ncbi:hypothetical protein [Parasedimentitalea psychrophila]|uniref:Uncharacterized protein n=1 Tax=Parasedimentitalea psychrophila TaxID=2997337 RepID=A0A9Y2P3S7_9RHOB|nr:hypothetical protein [Parasedimentitalea psychrophila]WIY24569.1 hypothetical protein QPJ95_18895 [Parasedimentitalea psychrophila]